MRRLGRLNGKVIVEGDANIVTKNQILYKKEEKNFFIRKKWK